MLKMALYVVMAALVAAGGASDVAELSLLPLDRLLAVRHALSAGTPFTLRCPCFSHTNISTKYQRQRRLILGLLFSLLFICPQRDTSIPADSLYNLASLLEDLVSPPPTIINTYI